MRVETGQVFATTSLSPAAREAAKGRDLQPGDTGSDSVSIGSGAYVEAAMQASNLDKAAAVQSLNGSYTPSAAELAAALIRKAFDR